MTIIQSNREWLNKHPEHKQIFAVLPEYQMQQTAIILLPEDYVKLAHLFMELGRISK